MTLGEKKLGEKTLGEKKLGEKTLGEKKLGEMTLSQPCAGMFLQVLFKRRGCVFAHSFENA